MIKLLRKKLKIIFITILFVVCLIQIIKTYFFIQPIHQEKILHRVTESAQDEVVFVIKEKILVNRKEVLKVEIIKGSTALEEKSFLMSIDGVCECEVNKIYRASSTSSVMTIDRFVDRKGAKSTENNEGEQTSVSFISSAARYKKEGIFFVINVSSSTIQIIGKKEEGFVDILTSIKKSFVQRVQTYIPFPHAELGHGLIISGKSALPKDIEDDFKRSGLMHIVVLSGFNVSIVIQFVFSLFSFGPKIFRFGVGTLFVVMFVLMAGVSSALLRATLMALIALLCTLYKKEIDGLVLLAIVGMLLIVVDPLSFYFDLSFWLSILATFGLISLSEFFQDKLSFIPDAIGLREAGASSLATQFVVTPLLMLINPEVSVLSFFANILILPIVPLTMAFVFITGVAGFITSFLAILFGHVSYLLLSYIVSVTHIVSQQSFATVTFQENSFSPLYYYVFIIPLAIWLYKKKKP